MKYNNNKSGFTLIELLIVIAIIGILAAVAIPFMHGHIIHARLTEVENAMATVKSSVTAYYQDSEGFWPNCATINEIRNSLGVGLGSITRISQMTIVNGVITATVQNIDPIVDGEALMLTPVVPGDGSVRWTWGASLNFPVHLRPKS
jgi:type IV pilus assembly protein PilA